MISVLRELEQEHRVKVTMRQLFEETGTPRRLAEFIVARMPGTTGGTAPVEFPAARAGSAQPVTPEAPAREPAPEPVAPQPLAPPSVAAPAPTPPPAPVPAPAPAMTAPATPAPGPEYATREELEDLARKLQQISQIQLQMMSQLSQLLALQTASVTERLNGKVAK